MSIIVMTDDDFEENMQFLAQAERQEALAPRIKCQVCKGKGSACFSTHTAEEARCEICDGKGTVETAQGVQAGYAPKIPPMGKLDIPARCVSLNECHSCGWLGSENEVPGDEDQCYCPNCHSDNIDDDVNLPRLFQLVRYLARAALATQPAKWVDPVCPTTSGPVYEQGFADGVAQAWRLNYVPTVRGAEHGQ